MATTLKQPADGSGITTTFTAIIDDNLDTIDDGIKQRGNTDGTATNSTFNRNKSTAKVSLKLQHDGTNSPLKQYKAIYDRKVANNEEVELTLDYGGGDSQVVTGKIDALSKTTNAGSAPVYWIVTISVKVSQVVFNAA